MTAKINRKGYNEMMAQAYGKLRDLAELTRAGAAERSPYLTGNNRDSLKFEMEQKDVAVIFTESGYGGYLELGTSKMAARPYIRPAYQDALVELDGR